MEIYSQLQRNRLAGAVAVVSGIGEAPGSAIARRFAAEGARLVVADAGGALVEETLDAIEGMGGTAFVVEADPRTAAGAREIVRAAVNRYGRLDILVHSLCLPPRSSAAEAGVEAFVPLVTAAAAAMAMQEESSIVLSAHTCGDAAAALPDATSGAAFAHFVRSVACELYPKGISVHGAGLLETAPERASAPVDEGRLQFVNAYRRTKRFEDLAQAARFLASSKARGITGQLLFVGGGSPPRAPLADAAGLEDAFQDVFAACP